MLIAEGYDKAIIGVVEEVWGVPDRIVYDTEKILEILQERDGMTHEGAREFFDFNIVGSYMGEDTPLFVDTGAMSILDALSQ